MFQNLKLISRERKQGKKLETVKTWRLCQLTCCWCIYAELLSCLWHLLARQADFLHRKAKVNEDTVVKCFSQRMRAGCALTDPLRASMNYSNLRVTQRLKLIYSPCKNHRCGFQACIYLYLHYANVFLARPETNIFALFFLIVMFELRIIALSLLMHNMQT